MDSQSDRESERILNETVEGETIEQTLAVLRDEGLIEWNGHYRNGRRMWVLTPKGRRIGTMSG
jgi:hypothetical protein